MIEFDCEGCGARVCNVVANAAPKSGMCLSCEWFCEHVPDPEEMTQLMRLTRHLPAKARSGTN